MENLISSQFTGTKILITGGAGFIGLHLARTLEQAGATVMIADAMTEAHGGNIFHLKQLSPNIRFLHAAVETKHPHFVSMLQKADMIFHLAGQSHHWASMEDPLADLQHNCQSTLALLDLCRHYNPGVHIIFTSTRQVYGHPVKVPVDETHPLQAVDVNGIHKTTAEQYLLLYHTLYQIPVTIARLTNTYGPGMCICDDKQSFLGHWVKLALLGKPFDVWGGQQVRDFIFVSDAVNALIALATRDQNTALIYNVGSKEVFNLSEVATILTALSGTPHRIIPFPEDRKKIEIGDFCTDFSRIASVTGWHPETTLHTGLSNTLEYYKTYISHYLY